MQTFRIRSINVSKKVGEKKTPVRSATLRENHGIEGDAHARNWHRQISLLAVEDILAMGADGFLLQPGDFAENLTTSGIDLAALPIGTRLQLGDAVVEVTQIGKECHSRCAIMQQVGDCIMPRRGIFAKVIRGGEISCESIGTYHIG